VHKVQVEGPSLSYVPVNSEAVKLDCSVYTCLTQLYGGRDIYNLLHKDQLHVSALFIGHLQVDN